MAAVFLMKAVLNVLQKVGLSLVALGMWLRFGAETRGFFDIDLNTAPFNIGEFCCCCSHIKCVYLSFRTSSVSSSRVIGDLSSVED